MTFHIKSEFDMLFGEMTITLNDVSPLLHIPLINNIYSLPIDLNVEIVNVIITIINLNVFHL